MSTDAWSRRVAELPELLTVDEAGEVLRLGTSTIYRLAKGGAIPSVRVGANLRFFKSALLAHLHGQTTAPYPTTTPETTTD